MYESEWGLPLVKMVVVVVEDDDDDDDEEDVNETVRHY